MIESPKQAIPDATWQKTVKGIAVLSFAGFCIFALSAFGWHVGVALADLTMRLCHG
jgi:hypothetical protein